MRSERRAYPSRTIFQQMRALKAVLLLLLAAAPSALGADAAALTRERLLLLSTAASAIRLRDGRYPDRQTIDQLTIEVVPAHVRDLPYRDGWGNAFRYSITNDHSHLTIESAGPNGRFESCGDDLAMRDGVSVCPASGALAADPESVQRAAARLTMIELRAIWSEVEVYRHEHHALPTDLEAVVRNGPNLSPFPRRDAWGRPYRYEIAADGYRLSDGAGDIVYEGLRFSKAPRGLDKVLDQLSWDNDVHPAPLRIEIGNHAVESSDVIEMTRAAPLSLEVVVTAPLDDGDVEDPHVRAANIDMRYADQYPKANVAVTVVDSDGHTVPLRITSSGGGGSETERWCSAAIELRESDAVRLARIKQVFADMLKRAGSSVTAEKLPPMDDLYVANPPGTYHVTVAYQPSGGAFGGKVLIQKFNTHVRPGPDSLQRAFGR